MIKITEESIKEHLISKGWEKDKLFDYDIYISSDKRYELHYCEESNLCNEKGFGWIITIDDSRHKSLAICDVEYIEQVFTLIDIYKNY